VTNHISEILLALTDAEVRFIVGGGVAAVLHGVERSTLDVDLALDMAPANVERFLRVMQQLRLQSRVPVPARDLMSPAAVERMVAEKGALVFSFIDADRPLRHVDIFLRSDLSFEGLAASAQTISVEGRSIQIVGLEKLLAIKRTISPLRDKDLIDIKELEKLKSSREKTE
jgi:predicted nucleotidyltransferase